MTLRTKPYVFFCFFFIQKRLIKYLFIVLLNFVLRYTLTTDSKYLTISVLRRSCDGTKDSTGMIVKYFKTVVNVKRRTKIGKTMKCSNSYMAQAYRLSSYINIFYTNILRKSRTWLRGWRGKERHSLPTCLTSKNANN